MCKPVIGYQVYSARDDASKDLLSVLKALKEMGYDGVEFAGFYGHSAEEVKKMLEETGLVAISSHVPYDSFVADMFGTIAYHKAIGCSYIAVPYLGEEHRPGGPKFAEAIQNIYKFGKLCKEAGITLLYHNHDFEFCTVSGEYGLDFLYDAVPASVLETELDCCWVKYAGEDPAEYIKKYAGRAHVVHLKDYVGKKGGKQPYALIKADGQDDGTAAESDDIAFEFRPVGHGCQNVPSIMTSALAGGAEVFIVEQDQSIGRTPLEAAKMSRDYLKSIGY